MVVGGDGLWVMVHFFHPTFANGDSYMFNLVTWELRGFENLLCYTSVRSFLFQKFRILNRILKFITKADNGS